MKVMCACRGYAAGGVGGRKGIEQVCSNIKGCDQKEQCPSNMHQTLCQLLICHVSLDMKDSWTVTAQRVV